MWQVTALKLIQFFLIPFFIICDLYKPILALIDTVYQGVVAMLMGIEEVHAEGLVVLITGCDTGIGRSTALKLAETGCKVYAGCYLRESCEELEKNNNIVGIEMDVTKDDSVKEAIRVVERSAGGLDRLINNAGILSHLPLELTPIEEYMRILDVNFLGLVRTVTQSLHLLRLRKNSRIINLTSLAGRCCSPPLGPYSCSKHAASAYTSALTAEMDPWGISVHEVCPGVVRTGMLDLEGKQLNRAWDSLSPSVKEFWGEEVLARLKEAFAAGQAVAEDAELVVEAIVHACLSPVPSRVYNVGWQAKFAMLGTKLLPLSMMEKGRDIFVPCFRPTKEFIAKHRA